MEIRSLTHVDINSMWDINEQGLPGTGKVSLEEISHLLDISELALGVYEGEKLPENKKSIAIRVLLQPQDKTFKDEDIENLSKEIIEQISNSFEATIRK